MKFSRLRFIRLAGMTAAGLFGLGWIANQKPAQSLQLHKTPQPRQSRQPFFVQSDSLS